MHKSPNPRGSPGFQSLNNLVEQVKLLSRASSQSSWLQFGSRKLNLQLKEFISVLAGSFDVQASLLIVTELVRLSGKSLVIVEAGMRTRVASRYLSPSCRLLYRVFCSRASLMITSSQKPMSSGRCSLRLALLTRRSNVSRSVIKGGKSES